MEVELILPGPAWAEFRTRARIRAARQRLYDDDDFRRMWFEPACATKAKAMCDRAQELGEEPEFARLVVRDITGFDV